MTYVDGFILAVPADNKEEYRRFAERMWPLFEESGVRRHYEAWEDDVPDGKLTDFRKAVQAKEGERIVFSWFEYPDRDVREAAMAKIMSDPRGQEMSANMPFDGKRMIFGGFQGFVDEGDKAGGYADGIISAVPEGNRDAYAAQAQKMADIFIEYGATRVTENWGDDIKDGKVTDFRRAVLAEEGEKVVFSFLEWPSKEVRDEAWGKIMADERMKPEGEPPFDGKRMFWGGFTPILDKHAN